MKKLMIGCLSLLLLSGCNYRNELKNLQLIYAAAIDTNDQQEIIATVTVQSPGGKERTAPVHEVLTATGPTLQDALLKKIGLQIAGPIGTSKNQVTLIGEKLAKKDLAEILDASFRSSNVPMLSKVSIVRGKAGDLIRLDRIGSATAGEYLRKILKSASYETMVPSMTLHSLYPMLHDAGRDPAIPILRKESDKAVVDGLALMHARRFTGFSLTPEQSMLYLLMNGKKGDICVITRNIKERSSNGKNNPLDYLALNISNLERKKEVWIDAEGHVQIQLNLSMKGRVIEYAKGDLGDKQKIEQLSKRFSEVITEEGNEICKLLQQANSDALGIARDVMAFYPNQWKRMDWETDYAKSNFKVVMKVEIIGHGIIN
ncbi:Ger(x)C family spore germination protein [Paenibacillus qinlingensis]|uniref:Ger(X)C family germination protein n=1 Tax=Paenibacillus qinlingensis TaxID=1837343 RepID=A0ABU1P1C0_9BACL|nr:Ger(x)C family spore germination protein [Paenibacillus qinlingensis]MDR6553349.1 Ger(x)C family germination protein [Paenibacillus qinlingensis]